MPKAYRIVKPRFAASPLDGEGAKLFGGRWNEKGISMVYTSASPSLAALETFVHLGVNMKSADHIIVEIDIPDEFMDVVGEGDLPDGWNANPAPETCRDFGNEWVASRHSAVLSVPSIVMGIERNYLINPLHEKAGEITIVRKMKFAFDERMWKLQ